MYLSGCVGCIPIPTTIPFWTQIPHAQNEIMKKSPTEVSEFLNRTLLPAGYSSRTINLRNSPPPSGLANLRALCATDMEVFISRGPQKTADSPPSKQLKFGINRILSEDFGKEKLQKENNQLYCPSSARRFSKSTESCPTSDCSSLSHLYSSISAVHSIHPSLYHYNSGGDILPGPYSILSTETHSPNQPKRKRSWSRAVFSNLQRKGLEKRFEVQKYVTKPDRRQLAAMLGLTDAQVKVWFQNRRMKWRHAQQQKEKGEQTECDEKPSDMIESDEEDINVTEDLSDEEWEAGERVLDEDSKEEAVEEERNDVLEELISIGVTGAQT